MCDCQGVDANFQSAWAIQAFVGADLDYYHLESLTARSAVLLLFHSSDDALSPQLFRASL